MKKQLFYLLLTINISKIFSLRQPETIFNYNNFQNQIGERSFKELITKINLNSIDKLWINKDNTEIISIDNSIEKSINDIHHTFISPPVLSNIIDKSIDHNIDLEFYKSVNNNILSIISENVAFLFNNIKTLLYKISIIFQKNFQEKENKISTFFNIFGCDIAPDENL